MKFKLLSDLHLEFYGRRDIGLPNQPVWKPEPTDEDKDTVLLLAGDIHVGMKGKDWIEEMCDRFAHVVYILGNHEFYNHEFYNTKAGWKDYKGKDNFTFLDDGILKLGNVRIIGGTLWTKVTDPHARWRGPLQMNDYRVIKIGKVPGYIENLGVQDTNVAHDDTVKFLKKKLEKPWKGKTIVMTHHLPHPECVAARFKDSMLTAFFMTDLDWMFEKFDIDVWCHGHTHDCVDTEVHGTRILCNPMGYHGVELNQEFNEDLTFEL